MPSETSPGGKPLGRCSVCGKGNLVVKAPPRDGWSPDPEGPRFIVFQHPNPAGSETAWCRGSDFETAEWYEQQWAWMKAMASLGPSPEMRQWVEQAISSLVSRFEDDWEAVRCVAQEFYIRPAFMAQYGYEHRKNGWPVPWLEPFVKRYRLPHALRITRSESLRREREMYQLLVKKRGHKHVKH